MLTAFLVEYLLPKVYTGARCVIRLITTAVTCKYCGYSKNITYLAASAYCISPGVNIYNINFSFDFSLYLFHVTYLTRKL